MFTTCCIVKKSAGQVESRIKVLGVPKDQICEVYNRYVNDNDKSIDGKYITHYIINFVSI